MHWDNKFLNSVDDFLEVVRYDFHLSHHNYRKQQIDDFIYFFKKQIEKESISQEEYNDLKEEIEDLKKENEDLEDKISDLENEIYDLRNRDD